MSDLGQLGRRLDRAQARQQRLAAWAWDARGLAETYACWALLFAGVAGLLALRARERANDVGDLERDYLRRQAAERARTHVRPMPPAETNGAEVLEHQADAEP